MKTSVLVSIILSTLLGHQSVLAQSQPNPTEDSVPRAKRPFILVDIAGFPLGHTYSVSWKPFQSVRIGYGRELEDLLELRVFAEYTQFDFDTNDPMSVKIYSQGHRRDFAIYPAIVAFRVVEIGLGGYYKIQDEVFRKQLLYIPDVPAITTFEPAVKKFGFYIHYGLSGSIHISGPVNISLGMFLRHDLNDGLYFGGRAGIKFEM